MALKKRDCWLLVYITLPQGRPAERLRRGMHKQRTGIQAVGLRFYIKELACVFVLVNDTEYCTPIVSVAESGSS